MLFVVRQEGHPACKKYGGWWRWARVSSDRVAPSWMVSVSASVNLPLHHNAQKFSSGTGSPGWSRERGRKTVLVMVVAGALSEAESGRRVVRPTTTEAEQLRVHEAGPSETEAEQIRQRRTHHHVDTSKQRCDRVVFETDVTPVSRFCCATLSQLQQTTRTNMAWLLHKCSPFTTLLREL